MRPALLDAPRPRRGTSTRPTTRPWKLRVVGLAATFEDFGVLTLALVVADLIDALRGDGPFTVFAPTDEAFAKLPAADLAALLKPENQADAPEDPDPPRRPRPAHWPSALASHGSPKTLNGATG